MRLIEHHRFAQVQIIFDLVDSFAAERGMRGKSPRPIGPVQFVVPVQSRVIDLQQVVELSMTANTQGYALFFGDVRLPSDERRRHYLQGLVDIYVVSQYYQTHKISSVKLPADPIPEDEPLTPVISPTVVSLVPDYSYPFPTTLNNARQALLWGHVQDGDKRKVAGIQVTAVIQNTPYTYTLTDSSGQFLFVLPDVPDGETAVAFTLQKGGRNQPGIERKITLQPGKNNRIQDPLVWSR